MPVEKFLSRRKIREIFELVPRISVDVIAINDKKEILLVKRMFAPYKNRWALPGGFVEKGETVEKSAIRECQEETGIKGRIKMLNGVYSNPRRDPRGHVISVSFVLEPIGGKIKTSDETSNVKYFPLSQVPKNLAADHNLMIKDAQRKLLREKKA